MSITTAARFGLDPPAELVKAQDWTAYLKHLGLQDVSYIGALVQFVVPKLSAESARALHSQGISTSYSLIAKYLNGYTSTADTDDLAGAALRGQFNTWLPDHKEEDIDAVKDAVQRFNFVPLGAFQDAERKTREVRDDLERRRNADARVSRGKSIQRDPRTAEAEHASAVDEVTVVTAGIDLN